MRTCRDDSHGSRTDSASAPPSPHDRPRQHRGPASARPRPGGLLPEVRTLAGAAARAPCRQWQGLAAIAGQGAMQGPWGGRTAAGAASGVLRPEADRGQRKGRGVRKQLVHKPADLGRAAGSGATAWTGRGLVTKPALAGTEAAEAPHERPDGRYHSPGSPPASPSPPAASGAS